MGVPAEGIEPGRMGVRAVAIKRDWTVEVERGADCERLTHCELCGDTYGVVASHTVTEYDGAQRFTYQVRSHKSCLANWSTTWFGTVKTVEGKGA